MTEPEPEVARPPGEPPPPAPPATADGTPNPDPSDPGPPITVVLGGRLLGDLGNAHVDALVLNAILLRGGKVGHWLRQRGIDTRAVSGDFPGTDWTFR